MYSNKVGPYNIIGTKRVHKPGIEFNNLPKIDLILLSHSHYDHMDIATIKKLVTKYQPTIITPVGNDYILKNQIKNIKVIPLLWYQDSLFNSLKITLTPAYHWSKRGIFDERKALWGGFAIETPTKKIYFAGDTSMISTNIFKKLQEKFTSFDLSFLPIGAYLPYSFMKYSHTSPEDAVQIHNIIQSKKSIGIHFGTFQLSGEQYGQPEIDLEIAKNKLKIPKESFITLKPGEYIEIN